MSFFHVDLPTQAPTYGSKSIIQAFERPANHSKSTKEWHDKRGLPGCKGLPPPPSRFLSKPAAGLLSRTSQQLEQDKIPQIGIALSLQVSQAQRAHQVCAHHGNMRSVRTGSPSFPFASVAAEVQYGAVIDIRIINTNNICGGTGGGGGGGIRGVGARKDTPGG